MLTEPFLNVSPAGDVAVDLGACFGAWSFELADTFDLVIAIEPNPMSAANILRSTHKNSNILLVTAAVGLTRGNWPMYLYNDQRLTSFHDNRDDAVGSWNSFHPHTLPMEDILTPSVLPAGKHIDFIKIDTEGAELLAIMSSTRILKEHNPALVVEVHSEQHGEEIQVILRDIGYQPEVVRQPGCPEGSADSRKHYWILCDNKKGSLHAMSGDRTRVGAS